ncbi:MULTISPECIES: FxLD family lanthipeptide [Catenuloplanes]|uniref:FxLD family lantipeptide n=1 Tax=Catenuloplanes niger TaxID=587534 RepID=A0AAE3ZLH8_9ACTN|nr:FxLD family lanthipeptide [Catenuloplanes niger]MDR7320844.1 FxLD family lantipeptide [Catenuloplanes niger]
MDTSELTPSTTEVHDEYERLDLTLVDAGPVATGYATGTDDGCGSGNTGSSACSGK